MKRPSIRRLLTWLIVAVIAGFAAYTFKFAPTSVAAHTVARGEIVAEIMGTGTLEARVKTTVSARIQERLLEVLVDPVAMSLILEALVVAVEQVLLEQLDKLQVLLTLLVEQVEMA